MANVILPDQLVEDTRAYAGELAALAVLTDEVQHWTRELKQVDENLELTWAPENVTHPALVPGRYHIIEHRGMPTPPNVIPLTVGLASGDPDNDGFIEPGAWMFEVLRRNDHWSQRSKKLREERMEAADKARQRAIAREKEDTEAEIDERIKALLSPGVSMSKSANRAWTFRPGASRPKR